MQDKEYTDLADLIRALAGVPSFTSKEDTNILAFVNRRAYEAYQSSQVWPRYLFAGEPRTITNQIIPYTQDGRHVFGAGTTAANGLYKLNGTQAAAAAYTKYESDGTTAEYSLIFVSGTTWNIIAGTPSGGGVVQYANTDSSNTSTSTSPVIAETGWTVTNGTAPAPSVRDLANISEFIRIHRAQSFLNSSEIEADFFVQNDGAHILNITSTTDAIHYVTYKKEWDGPYTSVSIDIPLEFYHFLAHAAYADFLRMDGQLDKAFTEEGHARTSLYSELERIEVRANNNTINSRFSTYVSHQSR